jgi:hypothetical protein
LIIAGALFIDGGIEVADRVFADALFGDDEALYHAWTNLPKHPLQVIYLLQQSINYQNTFFRRMNLMAIGTGLSSVLISR